MDDVSEHLPAIVAAMRRVHDFNHLSQYEFDMEALWQLRQIVLTERGRIWWRAFPLGERLFHTLAESQNWRCCYCGVRVKTHGHRNDHRYGTLEHIHTIFDGGSDHPKNLVMACRWCNSERGNTPITLYLKTVQPYY